MSFTSTIIKFTIVLCCLFVVQNIALPGILIAQDSSGVLRGVILDGSTYKSLYNVSVKRDSSVLTSSVSNGSYSVQLKEGNYTLQFSVAGFQSKTISGIEIRNNATVTLPVILYPLQVSLAGKKSIVNDSVNNRDSLLFTEFNKEKNSSCYNHLNYTNSESETIRSEWINPGLQRNGAQLLRYIGGVVVENNLGMSSLQTINVSGLGERFNQVLLNGTLLNSLSSTDRAHPFGILPVEAIDKASLMTTGNTSIPGDYAGGTLNIQLKDAPESNFFYVQIGGGFSGKSTGKTFYGEEKQASDFFSFLGSSRDLPAGFPTPKSQVPFNSLTAEERVSLAAKLNNNLAPVNRGNASPDDRILIGFGRHISLKNNKKLGIVSYLQQTKTQLIDNSFVQVKPDVQNNSYPFTSNTVLINAQSTDVSYRYNSLLSAVLNASLVSGRNKFSFFNVFGSTLSNTYISRTNIFKPDEDTLAHTGLYYSTIHNLFYSTQLQGEHAFGDNGRFKLNWHAAYTYHAEQSPDERSFLLQQDSLGGNTFEIAQPNVPVFNDNTPANVYDPGLTNSARSWRHLSEHNYEAAVNISIPFNLFHQAQNLSGGVYIQGRYRTFYNTLLQTTDSGYYSVDNLLTPENYASGATTITSYYNNSGSGYPNSRGNYSASANVGASYVRLENKLAKNLSVQWGTRAEAITQLVSNTVYSVVNTQVKANPFDKNDFVSKFYFLPAVNLKYSFINVLQLQAGYFKTINRPQLQELSYYRYYNPATFSVLVGNPILQNSIVDNFNGSISCLAKSGTSVTISGFYKRMNQPIENLVSNYSIATVVLQPVNMPKATVKGITADVQLQLSNFSNASVLANMYLFGNASVLSSKVDSGYLRQVIRNLRNNLNPYIRYYNDPVPQHTLSNMPDYTYNAGLMFKKEGYPSVSLILSGRGDYIYAVGYGKNTTLSNGNAIKTIPDYRVKAIRQLDVQVSQKLLRSRLQIIAGVSNLTNSSYTMYQDLNGNEKFDEPLQLQTINGKGGFYARGTDNTIQNIALQRNFYFTLSYKF